MMMFNRRWRPYPPEVTQQLERAFSKNLRSVFLGDSDPALKNYCIHLPQMEQDCISTGDRIKVRRSFFPQSSPAGQGAVWQWAGDVSGDWHTYDMCVQCIIEESWGTGAQTLDMSQTFPACPYVINFCNLNQMNSKSGFVRAIRRVQQASYPVGKPAVPPSQPSHTSIQGGSSQSPYSSSKGPSLAPMAALSCSGERQRYKGSKEDPECSPPENKPRALIAKVRPRAGDVTVSACAGLKLFVSSLCIS
ncbi:Protein deltex [Chionoecetes opilio]|uniref:E3 ubiquitin-protein ligase n=1 Tax=Chionoecetes opilio TaxID=41210 RepID=A0A8J5CTR4_CHIOP|nr:Protein deltex [Chionoecetes opilio]